MPPKKSSSKMPALSVPGLIDALRAVRQNRIKQKVVPSLKAWARGVLARKYKAPKRLVGKLPVAKGEGVETTFNLTNPPSPFVKNMKKTNAPNHVIHNYSASLPWTVGRQNAYSFQYFDKNQMTNIISQLPARDLTNNANRRFLADKFQSEITFSNSTNATCYVYIYDIMTKQDMDTADQTSGIIFPSGAWNAGEVQQGNAQGYAVIGTDPKKIDLFKQHFKILNVVKHFMGPGDVHKHRVNINYNKLMNEARIANSEAYGNFTISTMIVAHGVPANNDATPEVVSTTAGKLSLTFTNKYVFRYCLDNQQNSAVINLLLQPSGLEVVQDDGDIDPVTDA